MYKDFLEKYPLLFRNKDEREPINLFGIECSKGWERLLDITFSILYRRYKNRLINLNYYQNCKNDNSFDKEKLQELITKSEEELKVAEERLPVIEQCKEKFGTLRLYCSNVDDFSSGVIDMAEEMSGMICEKCGEFGHTRRLRWVRTLCDSCFQPEEITKKLE